HTCSFLYRPRKLPIAACPDCGGSTDPYRRPAACTGASRLTEPLHPATLPTRHAPIGSTVQATAREGRRNWIEMDALATHAYGAALGAKNWRYNARAVARTTDCHHASPGYKAGTRFGNLPICGGGRKSPVPEIGRAHV